MLNPATGDYVLSKGAPVQSDALLVPAYVRLKTRRSQWLYAPDSNYGSDFYTVKKRPTESGNQQLENIAVQALQPMIDDGRALQVTAQVVTGNRNSAGMNIEIIDASGGAQETTFPGLGV
jgi:phage gp46-like protein